jgi:hypothetical protein
MGADQEQPKVTQETYENYLYDSLQLLFERGLQDDSSRDDLAGFEQGRKLAYFEVISMLKEQAVTFNLPVDRLFKMNLQQLLRNT